jgi:hypothetical protein
MLAMASLTMNPPENRDQGTEETDRATIPSTRPIGGGVPAAFLVGAIAVLVVVVSLPRFRVHVLDANREDAELTLGLLGGAIFRQTLPRSFPLGKATIATSSAELSGLSEDGLYGIIQGVERLKHRFRDARRTDAPGALLHHGYRFATGYVMKGHGEEVALVAWPDTYGKSGDYAFAALRDGAIYAHPNRGLWSGADPSELSRRTAPPQAADLLPGGDQGLMNVDLSDESWILVKPATGGPPKSPQAR